MSLVISHFTSERAKLQTVQASATEESYINMSSNNNPDYILDSEEDKDYNM